MRTTIFKMDYRENPYYNKRNQTNTNTFGIASLVCGILASLLACCTGAFGIPVAALGLIFALLASRRDRMSDSMTRAGIWLNGISLAVAIFTTVYVLRIMLTDPAYLEFMERVYQGMNSGESYFELMQELNEMNGNLTL